MANKARFLVLSDNYYTGWKAYVNGEEKQILRVNYTLKGFLLDKGAHEVTFVFKSLSFIIGAYVSLITLSGVVFGALLLRKRTVIKQLCS
jgi:uncharacterized membrane protein YfhO